VLSWTKLKLELFLPVLGHAKSGKELRFLRVTLKNTVNSRFNYLRCESMSKTLIGRSDPGIRSACSKHESHLSLRHGADMAQASQPQSFLLMRDDLGADNRLRRCPLHLETSMFLISTLHVL
jgi:hypothetical protein